MPDEMNHARAVARRRELEGDALFRERYLKGDAAAR